MSTAVLQLDDIIKRHAWNVLRKNVNFLRRAFLDENDYICEVDWSTLTLEHKLAKFVSKEKENTLIETNWGNVMTGSRWIPLWSCDFDNKSESKQSHTFRGSRDTTTWVDVDLEQCYTINNEVDVSVNIPPSFSKFRAGRDNCLKLNKVRGQVFKELLTWEVNSQVEVLPSWRAHAQLFAKEECSAMEFEIRTTIYIPRGVVLVKFLRKSDRRAMHEVAIDDFMECLKLVEEGGVLAPEEKICIEVLMQKTIGLEGEETSTSNPQIITRGSCVCLSWSDQKVDMKTSPLSVDESTFDGDGNTSSASAVAGTSGIGSSSSSSNYTTNKLSEKQFVVKSY